MNLFMEKTFKFRLYPDKKQEIQLAKTFGCCRFVYNYYLNKRIEAYKENKQTINYYACSADLTNLKKQLLWLKEVDKFALQNALRDLDRAYSNFFREIKKGNKNQGFLKFKKKHNSKQSYRTTWSNNNIEVNGNKIKIPKLGWIKIAKSRDISGRILNCTITKTKSGKYFVSICCTDVVIDKYERTSKVIGIDLGIKRFATTSDGEVIENPKHLAKLEKRLTREHRKLSKKQKGSKNREKQRIKLARVYEKIANTRTDFLQKLSTRLIKENQIICLEDLSIANMVKNRNLAKSISDVSWDKFIRMLQYKALWHDRLIQKIDKFYASSQSCSACGYKNTEISNLSIREWECPQCHTIHDRDINAAINVLNEGLRLLNSTAGTVGLQACGDGGYEVCEAGNSNCEVRST